MRMNEESFDLKSVEESILDDIHYRIKQLEYQLTKDIAKHDSDYLQDD